MAMQGKRKEDTPKTRVWSRSDRLFEQAGTWQFYTREGTVEGPYHTRTTALERLEAYINLMKSGLAGNTNDGPDLKLVPR